MKRTYKGKKYSKKHWEAGLRAIPNSKCLNKLLKQKRDGKNKNKSN